jgi:general stress protein 26
MRELWVATASPAGRPDAVPVWFWWDGECVWFASHPRSWKARNIAHEPAVVLLNGDGADPLILKGDAERMSDEAVIARLDRAWGEKYVDPYGGARASPRDEGAVFYRVRPRLVTAWSYASLTTRTDWRFG